MAAITLADELSCARRALRLRRTLYPDCVARKRLTQAQADFQLACMEAIVRRLEALGDIEERLSGHSQLFGEQSTP